MTVLLLALGAALSIYGVMQVSKWTENENDSWSEFFSRNIKNGRSEEPRELK